jgi:two-component system, cell cycle response regulator DivK
VAKTTLIVENNKLEIKLFIDFYKLMDMLLLEIPGLEFTKMLKADDYLKFIPVVAVTAFAMKSDKDKIREGVCKGYIAKPISTPTFLDMLAKFLN